MTTRIAPANPITPFAPTTGVPIALYPSDPAYSYEIQRAPDVAGAPGAYATIATDVPGNQQVFVDPLPLDNATRWYRVRCTGLGDSVSNFIGPVSSKPVALPANVVRPAPVMPTYQDQLADNGVTGTLTEVMIDPQFRLVSIVAATQTGQGAKSGYVAMTALGAGVYTQAVGLSETMTATIWVKVTAYDIDGVSKIVRDEPEVFRDSNTPGPPDVLPMVDDSGNVTARFHGDSKTLAFRWTAQDNAIPGSPAAGTVVAGRDAVSGTLVTIALGHYAGIKVVATQNADGSGAQSIIVTKQIQRTKGGSIATKTLRIGHTVFASLNQSDPISHALSATAPSIAGDYFLVAWIPLPAGATIVAFRFKGIRNNGNGQLVCKLWRMDSGPTTLSTLTHSATGSQVVASGTLSETLGSDMYIVQCEIDTSTATNANDNQLVYVEFDYTTPDFTVAI